MVKRTVTKKNPKTTKAKAATKKASKADKDETENEESQNEEDKKVKSEQDDEENPETAADEDGKESEDADEADDEQEGADDDDTGDNDEDAGEKETEEAKAIKSRIQKIITHPEAKGREGLASHLAFKTSLGVNAAINALSSAPKEAKAGSALNTLMADVPNPKITQGDAKSSKTATNPIVSAVQAHTPSKAVK